MTRWLRPTLVFLLAGALLTIIIAWSCALWMPIDSARFRYSGGWPAPVPSNWTPPTMVTRRDSFGLTQISAMGPGPDAASTHSGVAQQWALRAGWPWRCLDRSRQTADIGLVSSPGSVDPPATPATSWIQEGLHLPDIILKPLRIRADRALPVRPRWPQFLGNTLVYALAVSSVTLGAARFRSALRRRRDLCVKCGYALAGLAMCPECGTAVVVRALGAPVSSTPGV